MSEAEYIPTSLYMYVYVCIYIYRPACTLNYPKIKAPVLIRSSCVFCDVRAIRAAWSLKDTPARELTASRLHFLSEPVGWGRSRYRV